MMTFARAHLTVVFFSFIFLAFCSYYSRLSTGHHHSLLSLRSRDQVFLCGGLVPLTKGPSCTPEGRLNNITDRVRKVNIIIYFNFFLVGNEAN